MVGCIVVVRRGNGGMFGGRQKGEWRGYGPAQKGERWGSVMVVRRGNGGMCGGGEKREWWDVW